MKLRNRVGKLMDEKNITQVYMASQTGIKQGKISEIVNNKRGMINIDHMQRISSVLGVKDPSRLFEFVNEDDVINTDRRRSFEHVV